jgi:3-oxoadipate enol-lactonase
MTDVTAPTFDPGFTTPRLVEVFSARARVIAMLRVESALASAWGDAGADEVVRSCAEFGEELTEASALGILANGWEVGTPVLALLDVIRPRLSPSGAAALHRGATSQDIIDTASELQIRDTLVCIRTDVLATVTALARHAELHAADPVMGRTFGQHAAPTTHGMRVARWLDPLRVVLYELGCALEDRPLHLSGPVGATAMPVAAAERDLSLRSLGVLHTNRLHVESLAALISRLCGAVATCAADVIALASTEIGEVRVRTGGSSAMPGKANPIDAVRALAAATSARSLAAGLMTASPHTLERGSGPWHAEWFLIPLVLQTAGASAQAIRRVAESIEFDAARAAMHVGAAEHVDTRVLAAQTEASVSAARESMKFHHPSPVGQGVDGRRIDVLGDVPVLTWNLDLRNDDGAARSQTDAVVLLHSLGATAGMWRPQAIAWSDRYQVIALDQRGHGAHTFGSATTAEDLGRDVLAVLDELGIERVHICGISLGGLVAQWLAINEPERVLSIVAANTAAKIGSEEAWRTRIEAVRNGGTASIRDAVLARWFAPGFADVQPDWWVDCAARFDATDAQGYAECCEVLATTDLRGDVGRIAVPTLVIGGSIDLATPPSDAQWLAEHIPGSRLHIIEGAAHLSNLDHHEEFTAVVGAFFDEHTTKERNA